MASQRFLNFVVSVRSQLRQVTGELRDVRREAGLTDAADVDIPVEVWGTAKALADLETADTAADRLDGRTITMHLRTAGSFLLAGRLMDRLGRNLDETATRFRTFAVLAVPAGVFALIAALSPLVAALTVGGAAAGGAAGGIGLMALAAIALKKALEEGNPAALRFQRSWQSLQQTFYDEFIRNSGAVENLARLGSRLFAVARGAMPALAAAASRTGSALNRSLTQVLADLDNAAQRASYARILRSVPRLTGLAATALGRLGGALVNVFAEAMPLAEGFLGYLNDLALRFLRLTQSVEGRQQIREWLAQAVPAAKGLAAAIAGLAQGIAGLVAAGGAQLMQQIGIAIGNIGQALPSLSIFVRVLTTMLRAFNALPQPVQNLIVQALALNLAFKVLGLGGIVGVIGGLGRLGPLFSRIGGWIARALPWAGRFIAAFARMGIIRVAIQAVIVAVAALVGAVSAPVAVVIGVIAGLVAVGYLVYRNWNRIGPLLGRAWQAVRARAVAIWNGIKAFLGGVWQGVASRARAIFSGLAGFFSGVWNRIRAVTGAVWNAIKVVLITALGLMILATRPAVNAIRSVVTRAWTFIRGRTAAAWNGIRAFFATVWARIRAVVGPPLAAIRSGVSAAWNFVRARTSAVYNAVAAFLGAVWSRIRSLVSRALAAIRAVVSAGWNFVRRITTSVWNAISGFLGAVWARIRSRVFSALAAVRGAISAGWNVIRGLTTSAWNAVVSIIGGAAGRALAAIRGFVSNALSTLRSWASQLYQLGRDAIQGLINGIISMAGAVGSAIGNLLRNAYEEGKRAIGARSPSRLFESLGITMPQGVVVALGKGRSMVARAARSLMGATAGAASAAMPETAVSGILAQVRALKALQRELASTARMYAATSRFAGGGMPTFAGGGFAGGAGASLVTTRVEATSRIVVEFRGPGAEHLDEQQVSDMVARKMRNDRRRR